MGVVYFGFRIRVRVSIGCRVSLGLEVRGGVRVRFWLGPDT